MIFIPRLLLRKVNSYIFSIALASPCQGGGDTGDSVVPDSNLLTPVSSAEPTRQGNVAATFNSPKGIAIDADGDLFIADSGNNIIQKISFDRHTVTVIGGKKGSLDGTDTKARFYYPTSVAVDKSGNVYIADEGNNIFRKLDTSGVVSTVAGTAGVGGDGKKTEARFNGPYGVAVANDGSLIVADTQNQVIRRIAKDGAVSTMAGTLGADGFRDGRSLDSIFNGPESVAVDRNNNVIVADTLNNVIRKITPDGVVSTLAGSYYPSYTSIFNPHFANSSCQAADGLRNLARFCQPSGIAIDRNGDIYVADSENNLIRKITPDGRVSTLAGATNVIIRNPKEHTSVIQEVSVSGTKMVSTALNGFDVSIKINQLYSCQSTDGTVSQARFCHPHGIAVDNMGSIYVSDEYTGTIRKIDQTGNVLSVAGIAKLRDWN